MSNLNQILNEMDKKGIKRKKVGNITIERYNPTPREQLENWGKAFRTKKRIEGEREIEGKKKANPVQWNKTMEKWGEIEKMFSQTHQTPTEEYASATQGD